MTWRLEGGGFACLGEGVGDGTASPILRQCRKTSQKVPSHNEPWNYARLDHRGLTKSRGS
ncbi:hypothetical protein E2C01_065135 [Portunus trituberculatus]|uniref:Uncharacterized protein n=1 Tax=Portunus trituberculatus TaxID=210409 RepID=A0A5B7HL26_PORTR|nr:hypothetical protein [Portunus trituberculatus]